MLALCALCTVGLCSCEGLFKTTSGTSGASQTATEQKAESSDSSAAAGKQGTSESAQASDSPGSAASTEAPSQQSPSAPDPEPEPEPESEPEPFGVSITVDASAAGMGCFTSTYVYLWDGATVYDALCATGLAFGGDSNYVRSINGLSEFDHGKSSGWMYSVNGTTPMTPCGSYVLSNGDNVYWYYVV